ncbi:MAG: 30S ribosomal protein S18 [Alphaproteobacteria bacterium]|nr:MAG: 30S ribosomal protein S18 [Alphaproteobacteria bacterium]
MAYPSNQSGSRTSSYTPGRSDDRSSAQGGNRKPFFKRRRSCPFSGKDAIAIDYKDVRMLQRYVTERGRIMPRRITGISAAAQRNLSKAIKRARFLALLPYVVK